MNKETFTEFLKTLGEDSDTDVTKKIKINIQKMWGFFCEKITKLKAPTTAGSYSDGKERFYDMFWLYEGGSFRICHLEIHEDKIEWYIRFGQDRKSGTISMNEIESLVPFFEKHFSD